MTDRCAPGAPPSPASERRRGRRAAGRTRVALISGGIVVLILAFAGVLLAVRYLPALDEARGLRGDLVALSSRVQAAGLDIDRPTLDGLGRDLAAARDRLGRVQDMVQHDPLVAIARALPPTAADVHGADTVVGAAGDLFDAADGGLAIASRFIEIKEARAADPAGASTLAQLVELMATSRDQALAATASLDRARDRLATIPTGLAGPIEDARSAMSERIDRYGPLLHAYLDLSGRLPGILGWDGPRRYLVLTQNPAELRPTGGFTGSYGIITFDRGRMTERTFRDIFLLDLPWDFPFVTAAGRAGELPPRARASRGSWPTRTGRPTSRPAPGTPLRLYANESGDSRIDGVLGITTYTIDELLKVTGPIAVPEYGTTIASGETTLKTLQLTRVAKPGENRKAFLSTFADRLFASLLGLPPRGWAEPRSARPTPSGPSGSCWPGSRTPTTRHSRAKRASTAAVREDAGDYLYPVDSNVAPASKINAITTRSLAWTWRSILSATPATPSTSPGTTRSRPPPASPIRELPTLEHLRILGMYFRLLVPERSRVESVIRREPRQARRRRPSWPRKRVAP